MLKKYMTLEFRKTVPTGSSYRSNFSVAKCSAVVREVDVEGDVQVDSQGDVMLDIKYDA